MGNASSAHAQASLQVVAQLSGNAPLPLASPEWQQLLGFSTPLSRFDPDEVEREIRPHCAELVYHNAATLNLQRLIYLVSQQLRRASKQGTVSSAAAANAVYCLRTILKDLMEQLNDAQLLSFIELPPDALAAGMAGTAGTAVDAGSPPSSPTVVQQQQQQQQQLASAAGGVEVASLGSAASSPTAADGSGQHEFAHVHNASLVQTLVREALQTLACNKLLGAGGHGYTLLLECAQLLLALGSSALYSPSARGQLGQHPFLDALMQQRDLANPTVEALLRYFIAAPAVPLSEKIVRYMPTDTRSVLKIVRTAAASVLWLPYRAYTLLLRPARPPPPAGEGSGSGAGGGGATAASSSPLGDSALLLLLVLLFHAPPQDAPFGNPYRQALQRLQDADDLVTDDAAEGGHAAMSGDAAISYAALYDALGAGLTSERAVLLLYALLHGCARFHEYCLVRSDLDTLLLPLLELLYSAHERTSNQMYMLLIILLMLSQDTAFAQNVHKIVLQSVPFYRERSTRTTLGSLLVVLLLRTAHYNLAKLKDVYLHTNTLAALANLAPHMSGLSTHAAQRLVSLFHLLARRYSRLQAEAEGGVPLLPPTPTYAAASSLESPITPWTPAVPPAGAAAAGQQWQQPEGLAAGQQAAAVQHAAQQQQGQALGVAAGAQQQQLGQQQGGAQQQQQQQQGPTAEQRELELQLYADFLRIVLEVQWAEALLQPLVAAQNSNSYATRAATVLDWQASAPFGTNANIACPQALSSPPLSRSPFSCLPQIINAILTSALPQNPELVYTLLHRQDVFAPFAGHPRYSELMDNIQRVTDFFNRKVEDSMAGSTQQLSVDRVLELIKQHSRGWRRDRLKPFPELRFTYEEESSPEEFFVPYVWSLVVAQLLQGGIPFTLQAIQLFTPTVVPEPGVEEQLSPSSNPTTSAGGDAKAVGGSSEAEPELNAV